MIGPKFEIVDLVKSSLIISELTSLCKTDITSLSFFENSKEYIKNVRDAITKKAEKKFNDALINKSQAEISSAIQIYYNLGILADTL